MKITADEGTPLRNISDSSDQSVGPKATTGQVRGRRIRIPAWLLVGGAWTLVFVSIPLLSLLLWLVHWPHLPDERRSVVFCSFISIWVVANITMLSARLRLKFGEEFGSRLQAMHWKERRLVVRDILGRWPPTFESLMVWIGLGVVTLSLGPYNPFVSLFDLVMGYLLRLFVADIIIGPLIFVVWLCRRPVLAKRAKEYFEDAVNGSEPEGYTPSADSREVVALRGGTGPQIRPRRNELAHRIVDRIAVGVLAVLVIVVLTVIVIKMT